MSPVPDARYPAVFDASPLAAGAAEVMGDPSLRLLADFFREKGLDALKAEDRAEQWYPDWIDFQSRHGIYAGLLSPERWSTRGHRFSLRRLARFLEVFAYFSPAHTYSLHVSFLGLFPILRSDNDALKREAVERLEAGGLFAFAVSEKAHGSDLFGNEFTIRPTRPGRWTANGAKYYIGNARDASMISVLAKRTDADGGRRAPFAFFAVRPQDGPVLRNVRKIRTIGIRAAFVGEFEVRDHEFAESDLICVGRDAWDAVFATVDIGKLLLGFGAIGICEHAIAEAQAHMRARTLYGAPVTELRHVREATAMAYARLFAMKLFADRALDYLQAAGPDERRYLLFNAVQKARVSTEGVKVVAILSECVGARGAESETYFESALRDVQLIPGLEGSTHINFGLTAQFAAPYFAGPGAGPAPATPDRFDATCGENPYWMESRNRNAKTVRFGAWEAPYEGIRHIANVRVFLQQVSAYARHVTRAAEDGVQPERNLETGRCFSIVAFAQLVAEGLATADAPPELVSLIFHSLVADLANEALRLAAALPPAHPSRATLRRAVRVPSTTPEDYEAVATAVARRYGGG